MATEIERKFLLANDNWRQSVQTSTTIRDRLIFAEDGRKMRVRREPNRASLTYKNKRLVTTREEFEYQIPCEDADQLLANHCGTRILDKTRHILEYAGKKWIIDEYEGLLKSIIIAEIELSHDDEYF